MDIEYKHKKSKLFNQLESGQCFQYEDEYYMVVKRGEYRDVVRLRDGQMMWFGSDILVKPVNIKGTIVVD